MHLTTAVQYNFEVIYAITFLEETILLFTPKHLFNNYYTFTLHSGFTSKEN